jgi:X-X-X-Leu-X-X-Gly heptad repeat protein
MADDGTNEAGANQLKQRANQLGHGANQLADLNTNCQSSVELQN